MISYIYRLMLCDIFDLKIRKISANSLPGTVFLYFPSGGSGDVNLSSKVSGFLCGWIVNGFHVLFGSQVAGWVLPGGRSCPHPTVACHFFVCVPGLFVQFFCRRVLAENQLNLCCVFFSYASLVTIGLMWHFVWRGFVVDVFFEFAMVWILVLSRDICLRYFECCYSFFDHYFVSALPSGHAMFAFLLSEPMLDALGVGVR